MRLRPHCLLPVLACLPLLAGCEQLGFENPEKVAALKEADGKAIGAACRHAGRAIEDCYALNAKAQKAAVFAGWKEMNDYMRENKIEPVTPQIAASTPKGAKPAPEDSAADEHGETNPAAQSKTADGSEADVHPDDSRPKKTRARG